MITDRANTYSIAQAVTATAVSTDVIDHQATGDLGRTDARIVVSVQAAFSGGTSVDIQVQTSPVENFGSGVVTLRTTGAIAVAALTAGSVPLDIPVPSNTLRYTRINYVVVGTPTAGAFDAHMVIDSPNYATYPDAVTVF